MWAPFFPVDLDHPELTPALETTRLLSSVFIERWAIDPNALQVYSSGAKGFHLSLWVNVPLGDG